MEAYMLLTHFCFRVKMIQKCNVGPKRSKQFRMFLMCYWSKLACGLLTSLCAQFLNLSHIHAAVLQYILSSPLPYILANSVVLPLDLGALEHGKRCVQGRLPNRKYFQTTSRQAWKWLRIGTHLPPTSQHLTTMACWKHCSMYKSVPLYATLMHWGDRLHT